MECVASLLLAVILAATGIGIGAAGMKRIAEGGLLAVPGMAALLAAVISIAVKEWMFRFTKRAAGRIKSGALMADAWHHRSDALSSVGAFAGILGARLGFPVLDPAAGLVICIFIEKAALEIFRDASDKLVDKACPAETAEKSVPQSWAFTAWSRLTCLIQGCSAPGFMWMWRSPWTAPKA